MKSLKMLIALSSGLSLSIAAQASPLRCNHEQTFCQADEEHLTVGDHVGFFNRYQELVAYGEVDKIEDGVRNVKIEKSTGRIPANSKLALLEDSQTRDLSEHYKIYRSPTHLSVGADIGMAELGVGQGSPAYIGEAYGQYRWRYGVNFVGRVMGLTSSGNASSVGQTIDQASYSVTGLGVMPGVAYILGQHNEVGLRVEGDVGFSYLHATVTGGTSSDPKDYIPNVTSGFGLLARGGVSAMMNMNEWHPMVTAAATQLQSARAMGLSLGVMRELN